MEEQKAFLSGLEANEDDTDLRMLYADWLEERGEYEEAERQRKWPEAKAWLVKFALRNPIRRVEHFWGDGMDAGFGTSYEGLLDLGFECADKDRVGFGGDSNLMDDVARQFDTFMQNWSIVTGRSIPEDMDMPKFSCSC